ncbi:PREDICTED: protein LNK2 isoform X2 [Nicotiana attenuata]|uniref:protein LNK2 isoform X2 n=1 Tax=Nicotiana attenuata TaxID=49451 RepID=UPI000904B644|nr:PREDICTED: protein LNK2 isoform X2 [Nicotiana attenuata]
MFDWNDEELTDIIWSDTGQSDDHTVPYPDGSEEEAPAYKDNIKKEWDVEASSFKPTDQKKPTTKTDLSDIKLDGSSKHDTGGATITAGYRGESSSDLSLTNATKSNQDSLGAKASNNLTEVSKKECFRDERNRLHDDSRVFHHQSEGLEQGDLIDYGWANIGSFDDLDKIFSDPIFGDTSLPNTHDLWSSSKDVTSSSDKSVPLSIDSLSLALGSTRSPSERLEVKAEYRLDQEKSSTGDEENASDITSNVHLSTDARDHGGGKNVLLQNEKLFSCVQGNKQERILKGRFKLEQEGELAQLQELCGSLSPQVNKFGMPYVRNQPYLASEFSQQSQLQGPECLQHKHFPGPLFASSTYGDMGNRYSPMPVWSQVHSGQASHQRVLSSYKASPGNSNHFSKSLDASSKPLMMTPQEKIEKLRRRQQLRAMLAIQKQQQQFSYQMLSPEQSAKQGGSVEENLSCIPSLDPTSPLEQGDSNTVCLAVEESSVEDTALYLLRDVISKLDLQIRLCIRDSLFRLAQSATQRQCGNDSCSSKKAGREVSIDEINTNNRIARPPNVETQTNPVDRIVAHLLFHNPSELTSKLAEIPKSSMSAMLKCERKAIGSRSFSSSFLHQNSVTDPITAHQGLKTSTSHNEVDKLNSSPCLETSENASNNEGSDGSVIGVEAAS